MTSRNRHDDHQAPLPFDYEMFGSLALPRSVIDDRLKSESKVWRSPEESNPLEMLSLGAPQSGGCMATSVEVLYEQSVSEATRPDSFCVFNMEDVREADAAARDKTRSSDRDRNSSIRAITERLLKEGGYRDIARPLDGFQSVQEFEREAPHATELARTLRRAFEIARRGGQPAVLDPILLVGRPGLGKTYLAGCLARALDTDQFSLSYAAPGAAGNTLSGGDKSWTNASVGQVFGALSEGLFANPMFLLDEIDKAATAKTSSGRSRDPLNELLPLLERSTASEHNDRYVDIRCDASHVFWIATANSLSTIPRPVLSRFQIIEVKHPDVRQSLEIARNVVSNVLVEMGLQGKFCLPDGPVRRAMSGMSPRMMRRVWRSSVGAALSAGRSRVSIDDLEAALGVQKPSTILH